MSLFDFVAADERLRCDKCGKPVDTQTKGALGQFQNLTINQLAAFMALYGEGEGLLLYGYCSHCRYMTYFELKPVTIERIDNPYEEEMKLTREIGAKGTVAAVDEATQGDSEDKSTDGGTR